MARLPKKPANIVHEFFPVGTDGHSPMNNIDGAFEAMLVAEGRHPKHNKKDKDKDGDTLFNKIDTPALAAEPAEFKPGKSPEERANEILKLKADTNKATQEGLLKKIDKVEIGKGASNELGNVEVTAKKKRGSGKQLSNQYTLNGKQIFVPKGGKVPKGAKKAGE